MTWKPEVIADSRPRRGRRQTPKARAPRSRFVVMVATEAKDAAGAWTRVSVSQGFRRIQCFVCADPDPKPRDVGAGLVTALCDQCCEAKPAALIRRPQVIPPDQRERVLAEAEEAHAKRRPYNAVLRGIFKDDDQ